MTLHSTGLQETHPIASLGQAAVKKIDRTIPIEASKYLGDSANNIIDASTIEISNALRFRAEHARYSFFGRKELRLVIGVGALCSQIGSCSLRERLLSCPYSYLPE
mgnify:CR=1 FL=1